MINKIRRMMDAASILLVLLVTTACGSNPEELVETSVAQTFAAPIPAEQLVEPEPETVSVETAVAQTVEAQNAVQLQVQQTVAAELATQSANQQPSEADVNAPVPGIEPIKPEGDPNAASGTPQLRVNVNSINVRNGPGTNYRVVSTLLKDSIVTVIAKNQNGSWFLIELPGGSRGWVADSITDPVVEANMVNVPVAATIPAPPPTATPTPTATSTPTTAATATPTPTTGATTATTATSTPTTAATTANTPTPTASPNPTATATDPAPVPVPSTIVVINNLTVDVCFLFIDLSTEPWSVDRLGPNTVLEPGFQVSFDFPSGDYDFFAQDCNGDELASQFDIFVSGTFTWDIR